MVEIDKFKVRELMAKKKIATLQENILSDKFVPIKSNIVELSEFFEISPLEIIKEKDLGDKNGK